MKRLVSFLLCVAVLLTGGICQVSSAEEEKFVPYIIDFSLTSPVFETESESAEPRVKGLILMYGIDLSVSGKNLVIRAETYCDDEVIKSGFKDFTVQRKKVTSGTWSNYCDYGFLYSNSYAATLNTTLAVESGYQYRISCKHYAKKNVLLTQSVSNTSNVVSV